MIRAIFLILLSANVVAADLPGRLFYTPQQRMVKKSAIVAKPHVSEMVYQGYVKRSDGVNTLWVNGRAQLVTTPLDVTQLKQSGVPNLRPGQHYDAHQHKVLESYEQAAIAPADEVLQWQPPQLENRDAP
ncbi:MAG: hypothetical protein WC426_13835 [Sulfuriferula sp.]